MKIKPIVFAITTASTLFLNPQLSAGPYNAPLSDNPVKLGQDTTPNILLLLDDSGSMNNNILLSDAASALHADFTNPVYGRSSNRSEQDILDFTPDTSRDLLSLCVAYNNLAYDPTKTYEKWSGVDSSNLPFVDRLIPNVTLGTLPNTAALIDPYLPAGDELVVISEENNRNKVDLSKHFYLKHIEPVGDSNGIFDHGECGGLISSYESIPSYNMGEGALENALEKYIRTVVEVDKGLLVDQGGIVSDPADGDPDTHNDPTHITGFYNEFSIYKLQEFEINSTSNITLSFLEDVNLASDGGSDDTLSIYTLNGSNNETLIGSFTGSNTLPPAINTNSTRVLIRFSSPQTANSASGFLIGWNLSAGDYPTNANYVVDATECANNSEHCRTVDDFNASDAPVGVDPETNYANWFSYYSRKHLLVKAALAEVIDKTEDLRLGLAVINNAAGDVGQLVKDLDTEDKKTAFKKDLFALKANGDTPLREALKNAGEYFRVGSGTDVISDLFGTAETHTDTYEIENSGITVSKSLTHGVDSPMLSVDQGGYCQSNYTLLFSDGEWNGSPPSGIGDTDSSGSSIWANDPSFKDSSPVADTLADVAMYYYETDLWPDSDASNNDAVKENDDRVKAAGERAVTHQHMVTSTISFGVTGKLPLVQEPEVRSDNNFGYVNFPIDVWATDFPGWPSPVSPIDDFAHAAWNGRGDYISANDAASVTNAFATVIDSISGRKVSASAGSIDGAALITGSYYFQSSYDAENNYGDVKAYIYDEDNNTFVYNTNGLVSGGNTSWSADEQLANSTIASREIISFNQDSGINGAGIAFTVDNISSQQEINLLAGAPASATQAELDALKSDKIDYLRGEEGNFRSRTDDDDGTHLLGPIVNASPLYVDGSPELYPNFIESSLLPYSTYITAKSAYEPLLFVGANDGMLHAFDATNGEEVFAYVPSPKIMNSNLADIVAEDYKNQAFVDGSMVSADVYVNNQWRTYLVGALRTGGQGIYVLDITDRKALDEAQSNANSIVKAEFTHPELGYTFGKPQIAKMNDGKWVAIFGNGYGVNPDCTGSYCGTPSLFILDLEDFSVRILHTNSAASNGYVNLAATVSDPSAVHPSGDKCLYGSGNASLSDRSNCNGLSEPALVDLNGDYKVDRIYAGDLFGNMWAFDVSATSSNITSSTAASSTAWGVAGGVPLFAGECSGISTCNQPITAKPSIIRHPSQRSNSTNPNVMVYFGTGQYIDTDDFSDTDNQRFYGIWDTGSSSSLAASSLQEQTITTSSRTVGNETETYRTLSSELVDYSSTNKKYGWYMDLPGESNDPDGERVISSAVVIEGIVFFVTINPDDNFCSGGGSSFLMGVDALNGNNPAYDVFSRFTSTTDTEEAGIRYDGIVTGLINSKDGFVVPDQDGNSPGGEGRESDNLFTKPAGRRAWSILH